VLGEGRRFWDFELGDLECGEGASGVRCTFFSITLDPRVE